jgi:segregation and condensation protein A
VKKHELDVLDIPVSFITEKYLDYLDLMRQTNLDIAGEYLLMAATLVHLKSRELLPTPDPTQTDDPETGDEGELDPRQELIRRLLEYQKYKEAAAELDDRPVVGRNVWTRGAPMESDVPDAEAPLAEVSVFKLLEALADVLAKARVKLTHEVVVDRLSITDRINALVDRLEAEGSFSFRSCFVIEGEIALAQLKHDVVVTFLAILEMTRLKLVRITQGEANDIFITRAVEDVRERARAVSGSAT